MSSLFDSRESREEEWEWYQVLDNMSQATFRGYLTTTHMAEISKLTFPIATAMTPTFSNYLSFKCK